MRDLQDLVPDIRKLNPSEMQHLVRGDPSDEKKVQDLRRKIEAIEACKKVLTA
jgi:hypothetical protein